MELVLVIAEICMKYTCICIVSLITLLPKSLFNFELSILFSTAEASAHTDKVFKSAANYMVCYIACCQSAEVSEVN